MKAQIQIYCDQSDAGIAFLFELENHERSDDALLCWQTFACERDAKQHLLSVGCDNAMYEPQSFEDGRELTIRGVTAKIVTEGLV
jgi:hypothetical protein